MAEHERQVELVAHHGALTDLRLVGLREIPRKAWRYRIVQPVVDRAMDAVCVDGPLAAGEVAQQAAERLVAFGRVMPLTLPGEAAH